MMDIRRVQVHTPDIFLCGHAVAALLHSRFMDMCMQGAHCGIMISASDQKREQIASCPVRSLGLQAEKNTVRGTLKDALQGTILKAQEEPDSCLGGNIL